MMEQAFKIPRGNQGTLRQAIKWVWQWDKDILRKTEFQKYPCHMPFPKNRAQALYESKGAGTMHTALHVNGMPEARLPGQWGPQAQNNTAVLLRKLLEDVCQENKEKCMERGAPTQGAGERISQMDR